MEASDIHQFIGRFKDNQLITADACHYIIRYWNETKKHIGLETPKKEEGYLSVMDFTQMVLPQENDLLRAIASQRPTMEADNIAILVER